jgi:hypothetical protein
MIQSSEDFSGQRRCQEAVPDIYELQQPGEMIKSAGLRKPHVLSEDVYHSVIRRDGLFRQPLVVVINDLFILAFSFLGKLYELFSLGPKTVAHPLPFCTGYVADLYPYFTQGPEFFPDCKQGRVEVGELLSEELVFSIDLFPTGGKQCADHDTTQARKRWHCDGYTPLEYVYLTAISQNLLLPLRVLTSKSAVAGQGTSKRKKRASPAIRCIFFVRAGFAQKGSAIQRASGYKYLWRTSGCTLPKLRTDV